MQGRKEQEKKNQTMETQGLEVKTKKCTRCGRELPVTEFYKKTDSPDGLQTWCKECFKKATKKTRIGGGVSEELKMYTSRQLMEELAKRGYRGELEYVKKVNLNNL